ncbi:MAG: DUF490 domain-containing protein, partial [Pseudomonadota bacterium]|nr:DUF490 domain-containing protein [Pseudomonadota bacterium]
MVDQGTSTTEAAQETPERKRKRRWFKRAGWALAIVLLPFVLAGLFLASPIGKRFVADQIAQVAPASGLRFTVGRIEGELYSKATLRDVTVYDPEGAFLTIPEVELDWLPLNWLWSGLDIRELTAKRARLERLPELLPGDPDAPLLPDFDIRVERFAIENLTLAEGLAGEDAQRVDLNAQVDIRSGRALIDADGALGPEDRIDLLLDAAPDGDRFDLSFDYRAAADGPIAALAGLDAAYEARIAGEGTWTRWLGHALVQKQSADQPAERVAAFEISNDAGQYGLLGKLAPGFVQQSILGRATGEEVGLALTGTLESSVFDGTARAVSDALDIRGNGALDLAGNAADGFDASVVLRDPDLLGEAARLEGARLVASLNGPFRDLAIVHELTADALDTGVARLEGIEQKATARFVDGKFTLPLATSIGRVVTGQETVDPRLIDGVMRGTLTYEAGKLETDATRIAFNGLTADMTLRGDVGAGAYAVAGPINARGVTIPEVGMVAGQAKILAKFGTRIPWSLNANFAGRLGGISNATIANVAGEDIRLQGRVGMGGNSPIVLRDVVLDSERLDARFDSRLIGGRTTLAGSGRHVQYGPFDVEAELAGDDVRAELVLADPLPAAGLSNVRVGLAPSDDGFALDVAGGSLLGPFEGALDLVIPAGEPVQIAVNQLRVYRTNVTGRLAFADAGLTGNLALAGGGLDGTVAINPAQAGATGFDVDLTASQARFGGETAFALASANIDARGQFGGDAPSQISADIAGSGLQYGALTIARFAAKASVVDGVGDVTASIAGRRADRFALKLDGDVTAERIALLARGEYGGRRITMPRRAVLTALDGGGYRLAPTQIGYARGYAIVEGQLGGAVTDMSASLARMPLRLADLAGADLGLSGRLSGRMNYRQSGSGDPTASARLQVEDFARSGLVLSSRPIDLLAGLDLSGGRLNAVFTIDSDGGQLGRLDARISGISGDAPLTQRIMGGQLAARLGYDGPAQSLWRLAAIETFDLTGPIKVSARATGTLNNPNITGQLASDDLRLQSA